MKSAEDYQEHYNPEFVKRLFNGMSSSYDRMNYLTSFGFSSRWRQQMVKVLPSSDRSIRIIDLLTGMGESWKPIRKKFPQSRILAVDFSEGMLTGARMRNRRDFGGNVDILEADILNAELPAGDFDILTCSFGLKTFAADQIRALAGMTERLLRPGGHFVFIEISNPSNPVIRILYSFYLGLIIPILGRLMLGDPVEYRMLWKYTNSFGNARASAEYFRQAGLQLEYFSLFFGCASGFHGRKPMSGEHFQKLER